jgi:Ca2+-binding RTX toxin-like protein
MGCTVISKEDSHPYKECATLVCEIVLDIPVQVSPVSGHSRILTRTQESPASKGNGIMNRHMESFESRRMMSIAASAAAGTLYVYGDNDGNGISVEKSGTDLVVKKYTGGTNYSEFYRVKANKVNTIKMYGRGGPDTLTVATNVTATAYINGEGGADYLAGGGGQNYLYGHSQNYPETDDSANDTLVHGTGSTNSYGQKGNDSFFVATNNVIPVHGEDLLFGGDGNDRFVIGGMRRLYAYGGFGDDTLESRQSGGASMSRVDFLGEFGQDTLDMSFFTKDLDIYLGYKGKASGVSEGRHWINVTIDTEVAIGGKGDDDMVGNDLANTLHGGDGNDDLYGLASGDRLYGENGNDTITGDWGNDKIYGGPNNDVLRGHDGNDSIWGNGGNDYLDDGSGNDKLYGGDGKDSLHAFKGNDYVVGGNGDDTIFANDNEIFNDIIFGGNEDLSGQQFHDKARVNEIDGVFYDTVFGIDELI